MSVIDPQNNSGSQYEETYRSHQQGEYQYGDTQEGPAGGYQEGDPGFYQYDTEGNPLTYAFEYTQSDGNALYYGTDNNEAWQSQNSDPNQQDNNAVEMEDKSRSATTTTAAAGTTTTSYFKRTSLAWFLKNHIVSIVLSVPFKLHLMMHFYAVWMIVALIGYNAIYATLYRMYSQPQPNTSTFWQTMSYFTLLIVLHFFIASFLTLIQEYAREFWNQRPEDSLLWGIHTNTVPHVVLYGIMYLFYIWVPFFWSICYTLDKSYSVLYFVEFFYFLTMVTCCWQIVGAWAWMYFQALAQKRRAIRDRNKFYEQALALGQGAQVVKVKWYQNPSVLKEYGMDVPSLNLIMFYTFSGFVLHILLSIVLMTDGDDETHGPSEWIGVGVAYFVCLWFLRESSTQKRWYRAGGLSVLLLIVYSILALASCGVNGVHLLGLWIVLMFATQGMCLRKRDFFAKEEPGQNESRPAVDGYLCCCKSVWRACFSKWYGGTKDSPEEILVTRRIRKERMSLWTDLKTLNNYLLFFAFSLLLLLIFGRQLRTETKQEIAKRSAGPVNGTYQNEYTLCSPGIPTTDKSMLDVALLTALTYSDGKTLEKDFNTWFSHNPALSRVYPRSVQNSNDIGGSVNANWLDFYDSSTTTHYVVVRSFVTTTSWMRDVDLWGETIVLQILQTVVPFVRSWPDDLKVDFVKSIAFLKMWYGGASVTDLLEQYIIKQKPHTIVLLGHGVNGGLAKMVAAKYKLRVVAFNSPGTHYIQKKFDLPKNRDNEVSVQLDMSFWSYIDRPDGSNFPLSCPQQQETDCAGVLAVAQRILEVCGDRYGRGFKTP